VIVKIFFGYCGCLLTLDCDGLASNSLMLLVASLTELMHVQMYYRDA